MVCGVSKKIRLLKVQLVTHACSPYPQEGQAGGFLGVWGQSELYNETLYQKKKKASLA